MWGGTGGWDPGRKGAGGGRREAGVQKWREPGEIEKNFATFRNILQYKWDKEEGTTTERGGKREEKIREARGSDLPVPTDSYER